MAHFSREQREPDPWQGLADDDLLFQRSRGAPGECAPPMDVLETSEGVEILMDLPGVAPDDVRVVFSQGTLIVGGRKAPGICAHREAAFHLAERGFGRFARAVRLNGAFDAGRATATLEAGELRIVLGRIEERRGRDISIPINATAVGGQT